MPQDGGIWCYHGTPGRPTPSAQWAAESLALFLPSKAAVAGRKETGSLTKNTARRDKTQALLQTHLNLLSKILLPWDRREIKATLVKAENDTNLMFDTETLQRTSTMALITEGRPRRSSFLSFSVKHTGTFPTRTCRSASCGSFTSRPKLRKRGWQELQKEESNQRHLCADDSEGKLDELKSNED